MSDASMLQSLSSGLAALAARAAPSLVSVHSHRARSSGFVWRPGLVVTSEEALAEEGEISVTLPGGQTAPATLAGRDPSTDVALLRIEADLPTLRLAPGDVAAGALTLAVGAHDGAPVAALGVVALAGPAWRSLRGGEIDARIELDVRMRRASEGGLAFDAAGAAFGMTVFGPRKRAFVIPAATIERVAAQLEKHGRIARGYLGLGLQPVRLDDGGAGAMVMSVDRAGPGAAAGVRQGDVVVAFNGEQVRGVQHILRALGPGSVGSTVTLSLRRAGAPLDVSVVIGERPET